MSNPYEAPLAASQPPLPDEISGHPGIKRAHRSVRIWCIATGIPAVFFGLLLFGYGIRMIFYPLEVRESIFLGISIGGGFLIGGMMSIFGRRFGAYLSAFLSIPVLALSGWFVVIGLRKTSPPIIPINELLGTAAIASTPELLILAGTVGVLLATRRLNRREVELLQSLN